MELQGGKEGVVGSKGLAGVIVCRCEEGGYTGKRGRERGKQGVGDWVREGERIE